MYRVHGTTTWINFGTPISTTTATITGLNPSTQYDFEVQAINPFGSATSNVISVTTTSAVSFTSITLTNQSFIAGAPVGTAIGTINVALSSGSFAGSLSLSGTDAAFFQIVGGVLQVATTSTTSRTYNINIIATQAGLGNSPFTQNFAGITASPSIQESGEGFIVNAVGPQMFASTTRGAPDVGGPWLQFALIATNGGQVTLLAPGQSIITTTSGNVTEIVYHNHTCYQFNGSDWWYWNTALAFGPSNWQEYGVSSLTINTSSYVVNAPANTLIGTLTPTLTDGSTFSGVYVLTGTGAASFKMVGNQLQAAVLLTQASYQLSITAVPAVTTDASHTQIGEQFTLAVNPAQTGSVVAPSQAQSAGYHTLVFSDDFTTENAPEFDALFRHVVQIFRHGRHLFRATLDRDHGDFDGTLPQRFARAVNCSVTAANDGDACAQLDLGCAHADIAKEWKSENHAILIFAVGSRAIWIGEAHGQHDSVIILFQLVPGDVLADLHIRFNLDSEFDEALDFAIEYVRRENPVRNPAAIESTCFRGLLKNGDFVAEARELIRRAVAGRPRANNGDFLPIGSAGLDYVARQRLSEIAEKTFHGADGDSFIVLTAIAGLFARVVTHASCDRREWHVFLDERVGIEILAALDEVKIALDFFVGAAGVIAGRQFVTVHGPDCAPVAGWKKILSLFLRRRGRDAGKRDVQPFGNMCTFSRHKSPF